jgi:2-polyprenyl-6-methoxyphenol hydroxylase-like FAD-dependent oxidoreductase
MYNTSPGSAGTFRATSNTPRDANVGHYIAVCLQLMQQVALKVLDGNWLKTIAMRFVQHLSGNDMSEGGSTCRSHILRALSQNDYSLMNALPQENFQSVLMNIVDFFSGKASPICGESKHSPASSR